MGKHEKPVGRASVPAPLIRTGWKAYATPEELFKTVIHEPLAPP